MQRNKLLPQDRRTALLGLGGLALAALAGCTSRQSAAADPAANPDADRALAEALAALETSTGGKFGAAVLDGKDGALVGHRLDERFTMCSTFKLSLAAAVLARIDAGTIARDLRLPIGKADPVGHSPVVRAQLDAGESSMAILALCEAAQTQSDNGAANILLRRIGGPAALTAFWRSLGDETSRLDRYEPELNTSHDGDPRDSTTAAAMAKSLRAMLTGKTLSPTSRDMLVGWMVATQTGLKRIRGGLPADWRAGDKTGTMNGAAYANKTNDIAIIWRPGRAEPFFVTTFLESDAKGAEGTRPEDETQIAEVGRIVARWIESRVA